MKKPCATSLKRAEIIEKFINIESLMNSIITRRFFKYPPVEFLFDVLYDPCFTFALRRNIFLKVYPSFNDKKLEDLNRLNNIRNLFAHCGPEVVWVASPPSSHSPTVIPDPKKPREKVFDFESLHKEFLEKEGPMTVYLADIYKKLGGEFIKAK